MSSLAASIPETVGGAIRLRGCHNRDCARLLKTKKDRKNFFFEKKKQKTFHY